jgi:hypothetical protein
MSAHVVLGFVIAVLAVAMLIVAIAAHAKDTGALRRALRVGLAALWVGELAAIVSLVARSTRPTLVRPELLPFIILGSAGLFTLTSGLMAWQLVNPKAHTEKQHWVGFLVGAAGLPVLAIAVCLLCARLM